MISQRHNPAYRSAYFYNPGKISALRRFYRGYHLFLAVLFSAIAVWGGVCYNDLEKMRCLCKKEEMQQWKSNQF
jgi:hypothetical protein